MYLARKIIMSIMTLDFTDLKGLGYFPMSLRNRKTKMLSRTSSADLRFRTGLRTLVPNPLRYRQRSAFCARYSGAASFTTTSNLHWTTSRTALDSIPESTGVRIAVGLKGSSETMRPHHSVNKILYREANPS